MPTKRKREAVRAERGKAEAVKGPTEKEWNDYRAVLSELYLDSTLPELMKTMQTKYNFVAS